MAYTISARSEDNVRSKKKNSQKAGRVWDAIWSNALTFILVIAWILPVVWIVLKSFDSRNGYVYPDFNISWSFANYTGLFTKTDFGKWLGNTVLVACVNCVATTFVTILTAFVLSRFRFKGRKALMNISLILGMFPGFMAMIAVYLILNMLGLINNIWSLLLFYVAGAGLGFFTSKGYFDTIGKEIDEAAMLDGASQLRIFFQIFLPLAKPIIIYTALIAFMAPWTDYILAGLVLTGSANETVAVGLYGWMDTMNINKYFNSFAAGCVIVAIPTVALYVGLQRFFVSGISAGAIKG
ncbi:MAG: Maltose transport system permease protein MalG [Tenericutes bacterium ADurb.BinA155]|jgi:arabinogalactan oligomer / maltooligosaccharide transport system permease protein|nr:MAG: Maltose transport system permease protein MalG [Tenericutes bacterium ADurb.BinA155]